ncbi:adenosine kinase 2 [Phtheirospermum japonicum]|uniref:Adenosine kinase n=1 Tax=Phtheirospermum japonicum TaxID=374723 RepID=A0A830B7W4_9LAMI|nr:adenosine kinase 2 [Phtheirospermum japonicum]
MDYEGILLAIGNPLLYITANVDDDFVDKYGLKPNKSTLAEEKHLPIYPELVSKYEVEYLAGGSAQNSMRFAQWMLQIPGATSFIGAIAKDEYGEEMKKSIKEAGVNALYHEDEVPPGRDHVPTGTIAVCVVDRERSLVVNLSAANLFKPDHLQTPERWALVEKAKYFYFTSFFIVMSPETMMLVAEHAAANNKVFMLNLSAQFLCKYFKFFQDKLIPYTDYVFGNALEARAFAKAHRWQTENVEEIALKISQMPKASGTHKRVTVITQGAGPVVVAEDEDVKLFPVTPLSEEEILDPNGAGDAFVGGFMSQLVLEKPTEECVAAGLFAANFVIQMPGVTYPADTYPECVPCS